MSAHSLNDSPTISDLAGSDVVQAVLDLCKGLQQLQNHKVSTLRKKSRGDKGSSEAVLMSTFLPRGSGALWAENSP